MGAGLQLLILLIFIGSLISAPVDLSAAGCLDCHPAHYQENGSCVQCHRGFPGTKRIEIAHYRLLAGRFSSFGFPGSLLVKRGEEQLKDSACRRCHISGGQGNRLATNLDRSLLNSSPEELIQSLREPVAYMPQFNFNEEQLVALVNAIFAGAAKLPPTTEEAPLVVHFTELTQKVEDPFSKHCGSCHRLLTQKQGGLGKGDIGPNLSGLFTEHYPLNFGQGERWTEDNLRNWLKNPRKYRDVTPMPPQILSPDEFNQLISILMDKVVVREVDEGGGSAVP